MQTSLHELTSAGGLDYFMDKLVLVKNEQDTTGLELPQKPRSIGHTTPTTPPAVRMETYTTTEELDSSSTSSSSASTIF